MRWLAWRTVLWCAVAGVGEVCTLVQAATKSTLQISKGGFMTIESSRRNGGPATRNSHTGPATNTTA